MNKTKRRSFVAVLFALVCAFVLVFSLGMMSACGNETAGTESGEWYYGAAVPSDTLGQEGDCYLNTKTLSSYKKTAGGWTLMSAEDAPVWHYGTQSPDGAQGKENDFYLNTQTGELYQKGAEGWGEPILNLTGQKGRDGVMWFSGKGHPDTALDLAGKVKQQGDFYINTSTWDVYQLGTNGKDWTHLGKIKGDDAIDPVQFYDGKGYPEDNGELLKDAQAGDLYVGQFDGKDGNGAGSRLYRYDGEKWNVIMESIKANQVEIYSLEELIAFGESVTKENSYAGKEVHLKASIDFNAPSGVSYRRSEARAITWKPIGTAEAPFKGTFDGEGNTIENFSAVTTDEVTAVGFFGCVEGATIEHLHFVGASVTASGEGSVGAIVVGQAKGDITVRDVTVATSTVTAEDENATVGSLVGKAEGTVTVEEVDVETDTAGTDGGKEGSTLVGSGEVDFQGENVIEYQIADGFVEKHYKNNEQTTVICEISNLIGFKAFRDSVNTANTYYGKTVVLLDNIDLGNEPWTPIGGTVETNYFSGIFDGKDHTVSNLTVNPIQNSNDGSHDQSVRSGLFGYVRTPDLEDAVTATVENLTIENVKINPWYDQAYAPYGNMFYREVYNQRTAAAVGETYHATISNVIVTGSVDIIGNQYIGGVVGYAYYGTVETCKVEATGGTNSIWACGYNLGGIAGWSDHVAFTGNTVKNITLKNDYYFSNDPTNDYVEYYCLQARMGGIAGVVQGNVPFSGNTVEGLTIESPWLVTQAQGGDAGDCRVGALIGTYSGSDEIVLSDNIATDVIVDSVNASLIKEHYGLVGIMHKDGTGATIRIDTTNTAEMIWRGVGYTFNGTEGHWYIGDADMLRAFSAMVNGGTDSIPAKKNLRAFAWAKDSIPDKVVITPRTFEDETVVMTGDVDIGGEYWTPLKEFAGTFKGKTGTETITGLTISTDETGSASTDKYGFISLLKGTVSGIVFRDVDIDAQNASAVGAVAAKSENATVSNVKVLIKEGGSIFGYQWVGGLVGYAISLTASGNEVSGSIKFTNYKAGGLVGLIVNGGNVLENNRLHDLTISTNGCDYMGGLVGGTSQANDGVRMNGNTFDNVTLDGSKTSHTDGGDIGALMGNVGAGPYYSKGNSGIVTVIAKSDTIMHHKGLWGRDPANLDNSSNPELVVVWNGIEITEEGYALDTVEDLALFRDWVNGGNPFEGETVRLTDDIDLKDVANWTPIGNGSAHFKGIFDGTKSETENYTISNLHIDLPEQDHVGLFSGISDAGVYLRNFNLNNVFVKGKGHVGAVAGGSETEGGHGETISNVTVSGTVQIEGHYMVGGIAGAATCKVQNCKVNGEKDSYIKGVYLQADYEGDSVGGIIGYGAENNDRFLDLVKGCEVTGVDISGTRKIGGIAGYLCAGQGVQDSKFSGGTVSSNASAAYLAEKKNSFFLGGIVGEIAGGDNANQVSGNTVSDATIALAELHSYDTIAPAILGGSRSSIGASLTYRDNTVGENVTVTLIVSSSEELVEAIKAVNAGSVQGITLGDNIDYAGTNGSSSDKVLKITSSCEIDLNGKTLAITSAQGYDFLEFYGGGSSNLDVTIKSSVKGGKIQQDKIYDGAGQAVIRASYTDLIMEGITVDYTGEEVWPADPLFGKKVYALSFAEKSDITINNCEINGNICSGSGPNLTITNSTINGSWNLTNTGTATLTGCTLTGVETDRFETSRSVSITDSTIKVKLYLSGNSSAKFTLTGGTVEADVTFSNGSQRADSFNATGTIFKGDRYIGAGEGRVREIVMTDCTFEGNLSIDVATHTAKNTTLSGCTIAGELKTTQQSNVKLTNGTKYGSKNGPAIEI